MFSSLSLPPSPLIIHPMNCLSNYKNWESMRIMNITGKKLQGKKREDFWEWWLESLFPEQMDSLWRRFRCWYATMARFVRILLLFSFVYFFIAPRVGCLNFHSLLELRRGLQYGWYSSPTPSLLFIDWFFLLVRYCSIGSWRTNIRRHLRSNYQWCYRQWTNE